MKTLDLSMAALIVGALGASFAACSAQSSSGPPRPNTGTGGSGTGTGATGTGATGATGTGATGTGATGATGTGATGATGTGATGATGTGATGATGTGAAAGTGTGTAGTVGTGTGGASGAMTCGALQVSAADPKCCVATGAATDLAIDTLEDGDNTILPLGNRQGYWYTYNDKTGNPASTTAQMPLPGGTFAPTAGGHACSLMPVPGACPPPGMSVLWSAETSGSVAPIAGTGATAVYPFAGMGFDFNNHFGKSCVYGGTAYHGISFWAKSVATQFLFEVKTQATTTMDAQGEGSCTTLCNDNYSKAITPTAAWSQFTVMFNDPLFAQQKFGTPVAFDVNTLIGVQFQVPGAATALPFDFSIDDIAFVP